MARRSSTSQSQSATPTLLQEGQAAQQVVKQKRPRRRNGDGTIVKRSDGRYEAQISIGGGKRKSVYGKTEKEVRLKIKEVQKLLDQGRSVFSSKQTLREYMDYWFSVHKLVIRESTLNSYIAHTQANIFPKLGDYSLQKLTTLHIQDLVATMSAKGSKPGTIRQVHAILHKALTDAVHWGLLSSNPCKNVKLPRVEKTSFRVLDQDQTQRLLHTLKEHRLECLVIVALATGLRRGELLGLHWSDIDLPRRKLTVRGTLTYINGVGHRVTNPKTASSQRTISLPQFVIDALMEHRTRQWEDRQRALVWHDHDLVFPNQMGEYYHFSHLQKLFKRLLRMAGLPDMRFHDLRHTAATILLMKNVPPKVVQEILGHTTVKMTMEIYGHVFPSEHDEAMDKMDDFLAPLAP